MLKTTPGVAIDTNVLVRVIVKDNDIQARKALRFIKKHGVVFVSSIVLCETAWVLESCYEIKKAELISVLESILRIDQLNIEHSEAAWLAVSDFKDTSADFSDCLIAAIAKMRGCDLVGTFDKKASKIESFSLIK